MKPSLSPPAGQGPQAGAGHCQERQRVLIVEDNRDAADSLRLLLELFGYAVRVAYSGTDGVRVAREWVPETVLCDIGLPGLDGYGVAEELRRYPATAAAHLIAITGYGSDAARCRSKSAGFDHHFTKPLDPLILHQLLLRSRARAGTP